MEGVRARCGPVWRSAHGAQGRIQVPEPLALLGVDLDPVRIGLDRLAGAHGGGHAGVHVGPVFAARPPRIAAPNAAPSSTWTRSSGSSSTEAMIWVHSSLRAPPPAIRPRCGRCRARRADRASLAARRRRPRARRARARPGRGGCSGRRTCPGHRDRRAGCARPRGRGGTPGSPFRAAICLLRRAVGRSGVSGSVAFRSQASEPAADSITPMACQAPAPRGRRRGPGPRVRGERVERGEHHP